MMAREDALSFEQVVDMCLTLQTACDNADYATVKDILERHVSGYSMSFSGADPVMLRDSVQRQRIPNVTPLLKRED
jgi:hypothetical protein